MKLSRSMDAPLIPRDVFDEPSDTPLFRRIYQELRDLILSGAMPAGSRLPSTRMLSRQLGVSRNTVLGAFQQLLAEGYVEGTTGSGTFVSNELPGELIASHRSGPARRPRTRTTPRRISARAKQLVATMSPGTSQTDSHLFRPGLPAMDSFPFPEWSRILGRCCRRLPSTRFGYGEAGGYEPLCESIAEYLGRARGVRVDADQVIIVSGSQQALDLAGRVLIDPGEAAWVEEPGYRGVRAALFNAGAHVVAVPVDDEGLNVRAGTALEPNPRLVHVSPSYQYPLGITMSLARRLSLLDWANHADAWILEDDYDSEFRYDGRPVASLKSLDTEDRVLYFGTFSKVLFPSLRIGYLVVPKSLIPPFHAARTWLDLHPPILEQAALDEFIRDGHFARHLRRMRALYQHRQEVFLYHARRSLGGLLALESSPGGMHLIGWLPPGVSDRKAVELAARQGIETLAVSSHYVQAPRRGGLVLGYAAATPAEIRKGVHRLAAALSPLRA